MLCAIVSFEVYMQTQQVSSSFTSTDVRLPWLRSGLAHSASACGEVRQVLLKLRGYENTLAALIQHFEQPAGKRLRKKVSMEDDSKVALNVLYYYTPPESIRTRLQSSPLGAQKIPRCFCTQYRNQLNFNT
jgi:hypothetical protein